MQVIKCSFYLLTIVFETSGWGNTFVLCGHW